MARLRGDLSKANAANQKLTSELLQTRAELSEAMEGGSDGSGLRESGAGPSVSSASASAGAGDEDEEKRRLREEMEAVREEAVALLLEQSARAGGLVGSGGDAGPSAAGGGARGAGSRGATPKASGGGLLVNAGKAGGAAAADAGAASPAGSAPGSAPGSALRRACEAGAVSGASAAVAAVSTGVAKAAGAKDAMSRLCNITPAG